MNQTNFQIPRHAATLRSLVEDRLRAAILEGYFQAGQRLVERELCELFGVGRTSVREALRQLEAEGLVTTTPHKGPEVSRVDYDVAEQIYAVRALLEAYAGEQFALRGSQNEFVKLVEASERFETAAKIGNPKDLLEAKNVFYAIIINGCENVFVKQMLGLLHNRVNLLRSTSMMQPGRLANSVSEIKEICGAIKARDGVRAGAACRHHVEMAARTVLAYLRSDSSS